MKFFLVILFIVAQVSIKGDTTLDYSPPSFYSMLKISDLVILSEIVSQTDSTVTLKIEEVLKGEIIKPTLELKKFVDWSCASRHHAYKIGQKQINILRKLQDGSYRGLSPGNEGELPIDSGYIYCKSWFSKNSKYESNYGKISGFRFKFNKSKKGLINILSVINTVSSTGDECKLFQIKPKTVIESMIIEEHILRIRSLFSCEGAKNYSFNIINYKM